MAWWRGGGRPAVVLGFGRGLLESELLLFGSMLIVGMTGSETDIVGASGKLIVGTDGADSGRFIVGTDMVGTVFTSMEGVPGR